MRRVTSVLVLSLILTSFAQAEDWPQWMGPNRDNVWRETGLVDSFPEGGPPILWRAKVAGGYAGPAVAGGKVYVTDYVTEGDVKVPNWDRQEFTGNERVLCLDEATGKEIWKREYPVKYTISYPAGPRCTPTVHNGKVYTLGAEGNLYCFDAATGDIVWSKDLQKEYHTKAALWGYAGSPLVDGNRLISVVGGEGTHAVAFDLETGEQIWAKLTSPEQGYSPPTIIKAGGARQLMLLRPNAVTSVNPETGEEYWSVPYEATGNSIIMSPVRLGDYLYVGGYSNQNLLLKLAADKPAAEVEWGNKSKHGISPINVQPMIVGETMYGFDQSGQMMAVALPSGERLWETTAPVSERPVNSGTAFIVRQDDRSSTAPEDRFWLFNELGEIIIAKLSPEKYKEVARAKVIEPTNNAFNRPVVWCAPAFVNRHMYVRNDEECICVDLAAK